MTSHSFAQAIRAIGEAIHGQPAETISMARLLTLLFEVAELFDMQTRAGWSCCRRPWWWSRALPARSTTAFNMWRGAEPRGQVPGSATISGPAAFSPMHVTVWAR